VVCIGGGPSLTAADVNACQGRARVIAINDAYRLAPWADVLYACDAKWWNWHQGVPEFQGWKGALELGAAVWGVNVLQATGCEGLEMSRRGLRTGLSSGYQALNLAVHLGARRIVLLGYDLQPGPGGKSHWFGEHPDGVQSDFPVLLEGFKRIVEPLAKAGIAVLNASRVTALTGFPRVTLEEALA
jgi:hypothetical protein